jgi:hypothetical protein
MEMESTVLVCPGCQRLVEIDWPATMNTEQVMNQSKPNVASQRTHTLDLECDAAFRIS